jgi:D-alanyl-D-alanine dipeptidase
MPVRRFWLFAMLAAACAFCSCGPLPGNAAPATAAVSSAPPEATMEATPMPTPSPTITLQTSQPSPTPAPAETAAPAGFEERVAAGLAERWEGSQAVVVRAESGSSCAAKLWLYEREGGEWRVAAGPWPAVVGKRGMTKRAQGENKSPSGAYLLGAAFGWGKEPGGLKYPYRPLDKEDFWLGISSPFYNRWIRDTRQEYTNISDGERLNSIRPQYKYAVVIHYNDECVPGAGGAIFLHVWKNKDTGTAGCTGVSEENMARILQWLDYAKRPVIVQGTEEELARLMGEDWGMLCLPQGWGFADDFIPDAQLEIRYNTENNFTGRRVPGYSASLAPMRMEAIEALAGAADELRGKNMGIRIYDAYRPQEATDAMIAWAEDDTATKAEYYPGIDKADIPGHYVARSSKHRLGGTVDLTLLGWKTAQNLDMGGPFDFFGSISSYGYDGLTSKQAANRKLLRETMVKYGFEPYDSEWWHFSYPVSGGGGDFKILPRAHVIQ